MASFVEKVLTSAGQLELQEATSKLQQLSQKIETLKAEVYSVTVNKYEDFSPKVRTTETLVEEVTAIKEDMDHVSSRIENQIKNQLNMSTSEFQSLTGQLGDLSCLMVVLEKLVSLQDRLEALENAVAASEYSKAADSLLMVRTLLAKKVHVREDEIKILSAIQIESQVQMAKLVTELSDRWQQLVVWTVPDGKSRDRASTVELKLNVKGEHSSVLEEVIIGMKKLNILEEKMKVFGERLLRYVLKPLITNESCSQSERDTAHSKVLVVTNADVGEDDTSVSPQLMFSNLTGVIRFLHNNLLHVVIGESLNENDPPMTLMELLGSRISEEVLDVVVKCCLIKAIPSSNKELGQFTEVISQTEEVHKQLLGTRFINKDSFKLQDYVQNVNVLFANKKCKEILERARTLMTTEVHNTAVVSHEKPLGELPALVSGGGKKARRDDLMVDSPLSPNTFRLPTCHISTSIQEVMAIAYEALHEATESSPQCAIQMFCAVRNMFELFCSVFPTYHRENLEKLPQFTALHYNNCMYISHHLMTLGHQFSKKLPTSINATFVDLVPKIRRLGVNSFLQQVASQKEQMSEYLAGANGFLCVSERETFFTAERALKQTTHQLQHLRKVWQEVLPASNYKKAIGSLLNSVAVEMTDSIVALEDISADDTKQLSRLIAALTTCATDLFDLPGEDKANIPVEILRNVPKWQRFRELDLVLNASMIDIGDRWAAGKGPLAVAFSADEVKQLIRALFQNTDRRAAMLAKIK